jgi:hypothetical protein
MAGMNDWAAVTWKLWDGPGQRTVIMNHQPQLEAHSTTTDAHLWMFGQGSLPPTPTMMSEVRGEVRAHIGEHSWPTYFLFGSSSA